MTSEEKALFKTLITFILSFVGVIGLAYGLVLITMMRLMP